ncbi:MAG TPA: tetratricopeptide repeat protein, partial [Vicinamibacteria bacterium]|nr:tetratricopeptide repeat protein [Vicinamibacteria bacterium]
GQKALVQLRAAEAALAQGDFDAADRELEAARRLAPWDRDVVDFSSRIAEERGRARREADAKAQAARTAQVNVALNQGATALQNKQYEAAIAAYEQALAIDPGNAAAVQGRQAAIGAKAIADAAASGPKPGGRSFVAGRTEAKGSEQGGLVGFEDSAGVDVKRGTSAAELPGQIVFDAVPPAPKPGERFRVSVFLSNEGSQAIQLATMQITTTTDGRPQRGGVPPATTTVAPGQRALVYQTPGEMLWKEGTQSWMMEIVLKTTKGETYRNTLSWK